MNKSIIGISWAYLVTVTKFASTHYQIFTKVYIFKEYINTVILKFYKQLK